MRTAAIFLMLIIIGGCSTKRPDDAWRYNTATAYKYAEQYFLEGKNALAKSEFRQAEKHARQSANMMPLARLYLSSCALNRAVLLEDACQMYQKIAPYAKSKELSSYFALLNGSLKREQIANLPEQYQTFARSLPGGNADKINSAITDIKPLTSKMAAASLAQKHLNDAVIESILKEASHFGYKRALLAWMELLANKTEDPKKAALLREKLQILYDKKE